MITVCVVQPKRVVPQPHGSNQGPSLIPNQKKMPVVTTKPERGGAKTINGS